MIEPPTTTSGGKGHSRRSEHVEVLAHHAVRGGVWDKALSYCRQAGEKAMARSAHREAASYFEQAVHAITHLPETPATREQAIDLRLALRSALHPCGDLGRARVYASEAETLASAAGYAGRLGQASLSLSLHHYLSGAYDDAVAAATRALALAEADGENVARLLANLHLGLAFQAQGAYRRGVDALSSAITIIDRAQGHMRFGELVPAVFRSGVSGSVPRRARHV